MKIDPKRWIAAEKASEWKRWQIQGFFYGKDDKEGFHAIRDVSLRHGDQVIWEAWAGPDEYDECHKAMMEEIDLIKVKIICDFYENGWPEVGEETRQ